MADSSKPASGKLKKAREKDKPQLSVPNERLKTIVRRLPPNLPEDVFWQSVQNWVTDETVTWKIYCSGKFRKRLTKENIPSRAYIAFKDEEKLLTFSREYDGHLFRDKAGNESQAVVEFAPYQKIPSDKKKVDSRNATIEKDEDYISFVESLNEAKANQEPITLEALIAANQPPLMPTTTPLLEALKAEKSAMRDKEAILRNHAHYKDIVAAKKDDGKKKNPAGPKQAPATEPTTTNKKAAKKAAAQKLLGPPQAAGSKAVEPPKPVRSPKSRKTFGPSATPTNATVAPPPVSVPTPQPLSPQVISVPPTPATSSATNAEKPPPTAPRRMRPVMGLASRHFEAALSSAGVSPISSGERKVKREDKIGEVDKTEEEALNTRNEEEREASPRSPRRDRRRKDADTVPSGSGGAASAEIKIPSILQRIDGSAPTILQNDHPAQSTAGGAGGAPGERGPGVPPVRGIRRGRGRGRGRGGPIRSGG